MWNQPDWLHERPGFNRICKTYLPGSLHIAQSYKPTRLKMYLQNRSPCSKRPSAWRISEGTLDTEQSLYSIALFIGIVTIICKARPGYFRCYLQILDWLINKVGRD